MSWQTLEVLGSIAKIEHIIRKFRELIDTDGSIPPELRGTLHITLDEHLCAAKQRVLDTQPVR
ncbi:MULTISPECIES: hypothetical protein [unclassified Bradyrhizobium]|uniref:hypothetical protein n=1 Tax=unclassified Bradyrhizobium TaxID=2631580 RepID=UPI002478B6D1|nr:MULTISPECIES: hypothetical protein [unclassified Bradyrhizobium]WGR93274.1 hypothetical protein MTX20_36945 [Bradyrhizobium sp. ISRA435]WGR97804.1 hypothetical protein MTX23_25955 [Bradyrhizobium sp. ISRA436]WGS04693.1 hypothetical protein MTX18_25960 [Bradyrhizobium sp. ISRA437]WGS11574.1 hypothetical protein MTX26_25960 [Bradyrhizobium sp. ISRA443]WGS19062.1 hypothetical protein MTX22_31905 [Bradyrhizobium sp. ISRA463]